jgi:plastocyanin
MKVSFSFIRTALAAAFVAWWVPAHAASHAVGQVKKAFTLPVLKAKVGDTVTFRNDDDVAHNVFSLSDTQSFDLGSYKKGESRNVKLEKAGVIEVECAIHPEMKMKIEVQ